MNSFFKIIKLTITAIAFLILTAPYMAVFSKTLIGVSWRHFQEERWRIDEAGIKDELAKLGDEYEYISADAQSDPQKQISDIEGLLTRGISALILLPQDSDGIVGALGRVVDEGIPVIAYDIPIDHPDAVFLSFDNVAVGRLEAQPLADIHPHGRWAIIKGDCTMPIVDLFFSGQEEVINPLIDAGKIEIVATECVDNWKPDVAQSTMEQILTKTNNGVDVALVMNDGMAGGVVAALKAQGMEGIPVSGQDGDLAALNRVALGHQTVSVWKNSYELGRAAARVAVALINGETPADTTIFVTPTGNEQVARLLEPIAITKDNLNLVVDSGWISKEKLCQGVTSNVPDACK